MPDEDYPEVKQILESKTLYEVLSIDKNCSAAEIKEGFRKLARKVHPDRCKHSKATEAFQKLQHAYEVLSDENKRSDYDRFGENPIPQPQQFNMNGGRYYYTNGGTTYYTFNNDISPEEIFGMFFGQGFFQNADNIYREQRQRQRQRQQREENIPFYRHPFFLQIAVSIFLMLLMVMFNTNSSGDGIDWNHLIRFNFDGLRQQEDNPIHLKSKYYKYPFDLSRSKTNEVLRNKRYSASEFYERARNVADELFVKSVRNGCQKESFQGHRNGQFCKLMREYRVN